MNADGLNGAGGGSVSIPNRTGNTQITLISATGSGTGAGGSVDQESEYLNITGTNPNGSSVDVSSPGGPGGTINLETNANAQLLIGNGANINGIAGNILANGTSGGHITFTDHPGQTVEAGATVSANGTTGSGGTILFQTSDGDEPVYNPLTVTVNGSVTATNTAGNSGIVGFNNGPGGDVTVNGSGTITGGGSVNFGNLDPTTLAPVSPIGGLIRHWNRADYQWYANHQRHGAPSSSSATPTATSTASSNSSSSGASRGGNSGATPARRNFI